MQARTTARKALQHLTIGVMIRWMTAIAGAALMAVAASANPQQSGPSANGPVALSGAETKTTPPGPTPRGDSTTRTNGDSPRKAGTPAPTGAEPLMVVPPAAIAAAGSANGAAKLSPIEDPSIEKLWPPRSETRGLGHAAGVKSSATTASTELKSPAAVTAATTADRLGMMGGEVGRVLAALAVIIGLVMLARFFMKRAGGHISGGDRPSGVVEILARYPVARGQQLVLLKLARRIMLLHQTGSSMTALTEMTDPDEVASMLARLEAGSSGRTAERFQKVLRSFESEHDGGPEIHTMRNPARLMQTTGDNNEVIDLTRSRMRTLAGMLMGKVAR